MITLPDYAIFQVPATGKAHLKDMKQYRKLIYGLIIGALLAGISVYLLMDNRMRTRLDNQQSLINTQAALVDSVLKSGLTPLMHNVLARIDSDLKDNPSRILHDETIARIVAMCYAARPYLLSDMDSSAAQKVSPERGQLLLFLSTMKIDSGSMQKILQQATFAQADLCEADLSGMDLKGIHLKGANLQDAKLMETRLDDADLSHAYLWGANLSKSSLNGANMKRAVVSWADLNDASLIGANLHEADFISAQMRRSNLRGAFAQWADLTGAFLQEADLSNTDLFRALLKKAQLTRTNLSGATMTYAIVSEANLAETNLTGAALTNLIVAEKSWLTLLDAWKVTGAEDIRAAYDLLEAFSYEGSKYQLSKKKE